MEAHAEKYHKKENRLYSYSRHWTGTSLQLRLMRGVFPNANEVNPFYDIPDCMNLHCKLVPVYYRDYKYGQLMSFRFVNTVRISLSCKLVPVYYRDYKYGQLM